MDAQQRALACDAVIACDADSGFIAKPQRLARCSRQADLARQAQTKQFFFDEAVVFAAGRFEDMRGGNASGRDGPLLPVMQQGYLGLRAGQTELTDVVDLARCTDILAQPAQTHFQLALGERLDAVVGARHDILKPGRSDELHRTGTVLANMRQQSQRVAGRDLKSGCPALQGGFIVGQQAP